MSITIVPASRDDLPALAEINRLAYADELPSRFAHKKWADETHMREFFQGRLAARFDQSTTQVFKAVDSSDDVDSEGETLVGFVCWSLEEAKREDEEGKKADATPTGKVMKGLPEYMNAEFVMSAGREMERLMGLMKGEKHYYLSAFAVSPAEQNKGIGSMLLKHCLAIADEEKIPSWLISFPACHTLYLRHGFVDVDHHDIDLNKWDGYKFRGYGIHRQYAMVRR